MFIMYVVLPTIYTTLTRLYTPILCYIIVGPSRDHTPYPTTLLHLFLLHHYFVPTARAAAGTHCSRRNRYDPGCMPLTCCGRLSYYVVYIHRLLRHDITVIHK